MGLWDWLSLFTFAWLRRCKACGERGAKCVCRRPSVALEHIFFLEERKNKYGARNFSHVSDTTMTTGTNSTARTLSTARTNSTTFSTSATNLAGYTNSGSSHSTAASGGVNFANNTVMMARESVSDCASVDYIYPASQPSVDSSAASVVSGRHHLAVSSSGSAGQQQQQHRRHHRRSRRYPQDPEPEPETTALVRKQSGRMVRKAASAPPEGGYSVRFDDAPSIEFMVTADNGEEVTSSLRSRYAGSRGGSERAGGLKRRSQPQQQRSVTFRPENTLAHRRGMSQQGSSFKFYGCGGSVGEAPPPPPTTMSTPGPPTTTALAGRSASSRTTAHSAASTDSLALRPSMASTAGSDRMSVDNNYGSYNPRAGRLLESSLAPSIQEEDEALQRLDGWLHSSPTSTADSFMMSRVMY